MVTFFRPTFLRFAKKHDFLRFLRCCTRFLEHWFQVPLKIVHREPPNQIHGQKVSRIYHRADVAKFEILLEYGGIYLDNDVIVVNSLDPVRCYDTTLGKPLSY